MSVEYSTMVGYGFVLRKKEGMQKTHISDLHDLIYKKVRPEHFALTFAGNFMQGPDVDLVLFLKDPSYLVFSKYESEPTGAFVFDEQPDLSDDVLRELEEVKEFADFEQESPKVIAAFSIS